VSPRTRGPQPRATSRGASGRRTQCEPPRRLSDDEGKGSDGRNGHGGLLTLMVP
jgi:hypothetical protein